MFFANHEAPRHRTTPARKILPTHARLSRECKICLFFSLQDKVVKGKQNNWRAFQFCLGGATLVCRKRNPFLVDDTAEKSTETWSLGFAYAKDFVSQSRVVVHRNTARVRIIKGLW